MRSGSRAAPRSASRSGSWRVCEGVILCIGLLAQAAVLTSAAQDPVLKTRTKAERDRQYVASHRVTVNVQVNDAGGNPIPNLRAQDFVLYDDHQPRKITAVHEIVGQVMNDAAEVVIVLDAVNSTEQALQAEREGIFQYLVRSRGPLPYTTVFALWFNGHLKATVPTTDRNAVGRAFVRMTKGMHSNACAPSGDSVTRALAGAGAASPAQSTIDGRPVSMETCLEVHFKDSLAALDGIAQQQKTSGGRTILIWMGPGWPLPSDAALQSATPNVRRGDMEELVTLTHDLREAQVTVDVLSPRGTAEASPTGSPQDAGSRSLALQTLARQTGGRVLNASEDITEDLTSCIRDADSYYVLSFEMMPASSPHELHPLEVKVNRPGVEVRTMTQYYAEP